VLSVDRDQYQEWVDQAVEILEGRSDQIVSKLTALMEQAAEDLRFEEAAALRDRIAILSEFGEGYQRVLHPGHNRDAFGFRMEGEEATLSVLSVRGGRIVGSNCFSFEQIPFEAVQLIEEVVERYYLTDGSQIPEEILLPLSLSEDSLLGEALEQLKGSKVKLVSAERGAHKRLIELANLNAAQYFQTVFDAEIVYARIAARLSKLLRLDQCPRRIECVDISTLQGCEEVGGVVAFYDGEPLKSGYRRYRLSDRGKPDDFASIYEVVRRRLTSGAEKGDLPDLLIIDGGKGQLNAALKARAELGLAVNIVSLAKQRSVGSRRTKEQPERVFIEGAATPFKLDPSDSVTHLLERVRDEAHRWVIEYNRSRRIKRGLASVLDEITGIGPERRIRLTKQFGSVTKLAEASVEEIAKAGRMSLNLAEKIKGRLNQG
jgi:excinuclease ABC subunit C